MYMNSSHDAYLIEEESDEECAESSDDDIDTILHSTSEHRRRPKRLHELREEESSSEDEFEKEMASELNAKMKKIERQWTTAGETKSSQLQHGTDELDDSDDDDDSATEQQAAPLSNDDLLYDPEMDDDDESWINRQRQSYQPAAARHAADADAGGATRRLPNSDAVLNCPACMSLLCLDCQRHETYQHQYRAMFVTNCCVRMNEVLRYDQTPAEKKTKHKSKRRRGAQAASTTSDTSAASTVADAASDDVYHPVVCSVCSSEVGVYDKDEVYHFFNVLASYA